MAALVYILTYADGACYVGTTRGSLEQRVAQHNAGTFGGFTKRRRPARLVYHQEFNRITDAIAAERQLKGWTRAKKVALIAGDMERLRAIGEPGRRPSSGGLAGRGEPSKGTRET